ncbi:MAG: hypothetical protein AAF432_06300 [Planctomycetota bacterium]
MSYDLYLYPKDSDANEVYDLIEEPTEEQIALLERAIQGVDIEAIVDRHFPLMDVPDFGPARSADIDNEGAILILHATYNPIAGSSDDLMRHVLQCVADIQKQSPLLCFDAQLDAVIDPQSELDMLTTKYAEGRTMLDSYTGQGAPTQPRIASQPAKSPWWKFWSS